jgi:hypothetical protein
LSIQRSCTKAEKRRLNQVYAPAFIAIREQTQASYLDPQSNKRRMANYQEETSSSCWVFLTHWQGDPKFWETRFRRRCSLLSPVIRQGLVGFVVPGRNEQGRSSTFTSSPQILMYCLLVGVHGVPPPSGWMTDPVIASSWFPYVGYLGCRLLLPSSVSSGQALVQSTSSYLSSRSRFTHPAGTKLVENSQSYANPNRDF